MPEWSQAQRRKAAQLAPDFAQVRLVEAFERGWEIGFECLHCGARRIWRCDVMIGRARRLLNATMAEVQAKAVCPRCPGRPADAAGDNRGGTVSVSLVFLRLPEGQSEAGGQAIFAETGLFLRASMPPPSRLRIA